MKLIKSLKEQTGITALQEIIIPNDSKSRPPIKAMLFILLLMILAFSANEVDAHLQQLPFYSFTSLIITYRWWVILGLLLLAITRSSRNNK